VIIETKVVRIGDHLPLSTRRVVVYFGKTTETEVAIGAVSGMADGAVLLRLPKILKSATVDYELTPKQALEFAKALEHAAYGVEHWQEHASGFNRVRVARTDGKVSVTYRGRTRPMRLSKLRGRKYRDGTVRFRGVCGACHARDQQALYVAADDLREHDVRVHHVEVCPACVDKLANLPETIAEVTPISVAAK
jgi:hypothetical protein